MTEEREYSAVEKAAGVGIDMSVIGSTGLKRSGGQVNQEFHRALKGSRGIKTYTEMRDNDAIIGAILKIFELVISQLETRVEVGPDGDPRAEAAAQFLQECVDDMSHSLASLIEEALSMLVFGWSYHEIVYKIRGGPSDDPTRRSKYVDGRIGWRKMPIRLQETLVRWEFDEDDDVQGMTQRVYGKGTVTIPIEKALLFRTKSVGGNPQGVSILRNAYRPWYFKKHLEEVEAIGIETDLTGLKVMRVPPAVLDIKASTATRATLTAVETQMQQAHRDERACLILPAPETPDGKKTGWDFELMASPGRHPIDTNEVIKRYRGEEAMSTLTALILLGVDGVGSYALSQTHNDLANLMVNGIIGKIYGTMNAHAVPRLMQLQPDFASHPGSWARLAHAKVVTPTLGELADAINKLSGSAILTVTDEDERHIRRKADMGESFPERTRREAA